MFSMEKLLKLKGTGKSSELQMLEFLQNTKKTWILVTTNSTCKKGKLNHANIAF